jgi:hypothetical protein
MKEATADDLKTVAFQLGQGSKQFHFSSLKSRAAIGLIEGKEVYTKKEVANITCIFDCLPDC